MYKPSTYLVVTYFPTYLPIYETYFITELVTKVKPKNNSDEASSRLNLLSRGPPLSLFDMLPHVSRGLGNLMGFGNLMFPLWFALLGGSFVFLDMSPSFFVPCIPPFFLVLCVYI
jgi:hypothetical protein